LQGNGEAIGGRNIALGRRDVRSALFGRGILEEEEGEGYIFERHRLSVDEVRLFEIVLRGEDKEWLGYAFLASEATLEMGNVPRTQRTK
jgi:hypothetical protein